MPEHSASSDLEQEVAALHERHSVELLTYASSIVRDTESALDAVQEAFLRYFVERSYGRAIQNPRAWLYRVVHNHLMDRRDKAATKYEVYSADVRNMPDPRQSPGCSHPGRWSVSVCARKVWRMIRSLQL